MPTAEIFKFCFPPNGPLMDIVSTAPPVEVHLTLKTPFLLSDTSKVTTTLRTKQTRLYYCCILTGIITKESVTPYNMDGTGQNSCYPHTKWLKTKQERLATKFGTLA